MLQDVGNACAVCWGGAESDGKYFVFVGTGYGEYAGVGFFVAEDGAGGVDFFDLLLLYEGVGGGDGVVCHGLVGPFLY